MVKLVAPSVEYAKTVLETLAEYAEHGMDHEYENQSVAAVDFPRFVRELQRSGSGECQEPNTVPESYFWLIDDEGQHVGDVSVRHYLSERLLREGGHVSYTVRPSQRRKGYGTALLQLILPKAAGLGLRRVLVLCYEDNSPSIKIIERMGGRLEDRIIAEGNGRAVLRYWITV